MIHGHRFVESRSLCNITARPTHPSATAAWDEDSSVAARRGLQLGECRERRVAHAPLRSQARWHRTNPTRGPKRIAFGQSLHQEHGTAPISKGTLVPQRTKVENRLRRANQHTQM